VQETDGVSGFNLYVSISQFLTLMKMHTSVTVCNTKCHTGTMNVWNNSLKDPVKPLETAVAIFQYPNRTLIYQQIFSNYLLCQHIHHHKASLATYHFCIHRLFATETDHPRLSTNSLMPNQVLLMITITYICIDMKSLI